MKSLFLCFLLFACKTSAPPISSASGYLSEDIGIETGNVNGKIVSFEVMSNLQDPRAIFSLLIFSDRGDRPVEEPFAKIYRTIHKINTNSAPGKEIKMVLVVPSPTLSAEIDDVEGYTRLQMQKLADELALDSLSNFTFTVLNQPIEKWLQDYAEFGPVTVEGQTAKQLGIYDLNHNDETYFAKDMQVALELPRIHLKNSSGPDLTSSTTVEGGNVEASPEGFAYVGNTISTDNLDRMTGLLGKKAAILPTDWLETGHVDEYLSFIPSRDACGYTLLAADPLEALWLIANGNDSQIGTYGKQGERYFAPTGLRNEYNRSNVIGTFLRNPELLRSTTTWKLTDFDMSKDIRNRRALKGELDANGEISSENLLSQAENDLPVYLNIHAAQSIEDSITSLRKASTCDFKVVRLPMLFEFSQEIAQGYDYLYTSKRLLRGLSFSLNGVVLRDYFLMPQGLFQSINVPRIESVLGSGHVQVIDLAETIENFGEFGGSLHCTTMTLRNPNSKFVFDHNP
jgi:hypothetical protein